MLKIKKCLFVLLLPVLIAGCTTVGNLTPGQYPGSASGFYRVEASWRTTQSDVVPGSITASVMVGNNSYDMRPVPVVQDRWEAFIPVSAGAEEIRYRYRFDFMKYAIGGQKPDSVLSPE